jgi:glyoxylase-like metal-dependent hydrolase (beta-lactamase superfamily II)
VLSSITVCLAPLACRATGPSGLQNAPAAQEVVDGGGSQVGRPLAVSWNHAVPDCDAGNADEPIQVFHYDADTVILRQNLCLSPEAPFMYLLMGSSKALLLDTGDVEDPAAFPLRETVQRLLAENAGRRGGAARQLIVAHTHGHSDHRMGDFQFENQPNTTVVGLGQAQVGAFFGFSSWTGPAITFDLGGRILDVLPIPGHNSDHIAVYDRKAALLLTGDTLYAGRLYTEEGSWSDYQESVARLWAFAKDKPVAHVLGAHIEMRNQPKLDYPMNDMAGRPDEHLLELKLDHLRELNEALQRLAAPTCEAHSDFIIWPWDAEPSCESIIHGRPPAP